VRRKEKQKLDQLVKRESVVLYDIVLFELIGTAFVMLLLIALAIVI